MFNSLVHKGANWEYYQATDRVLQHLPAHEHFQGTVWELFCHHHLANDMLVLCCTTSILFTNIYDHELYMLNVNIKLMFCSVQQLYSLKCKLSDWIPINKTNRSLTALQKIASFYIKTWATNQIEIYTLTIQVQTKPEITAMFAMMKKIKSNTNTYKLVYFFLWISISWYTRNNPKQVNPSMWYEINPLNCLSTSIFFNL